MDLEASQQGEVKEGDPARITLPGNISVTGKVDRLGRIAQVPAGHATPLPGNTWRSRPSRPSSVSTIRHKQAGSTRPRSRVEITTRGVESASSVPVTALVGKSGGFAVEVVRAGGRRELVAVKLGLFDTAADGSRSRASQAKAIVAVPSP